MNQEKKISQALNRISQENVPENVNLWPNIARRIQQEPRAASRSRRRLSWAFVMALLALAIVSTAAYAFFRRMIDPGLQGVEDTGLIVDLNQTAEPTLFAPVSADSVPSGVAQTQQGITVTMNWAYADESRMAMQLSVLGLDLDSRTRIDDVICTPYLSSEERISFSLGMTQARVLEDQPGKPIELTYIYYQAIDAGQFTRLNIDLDLTIGPCGEYWDFEETNLEKPTALPLIGNFHLKFQAPVYRGIDLAINETVEANGVSLRLESVSLNPSFTSLRVCYRLPVEMKGLTPETLDLVEASLQIGEAAPVDNVNYQVVSGEKGPSEPCIELGFAVPYDDETQAVILNVERLIFADQTIEGRWIFRVTVKP